MNTMNLIRPASTAKVDTTEVSIAEVGSVEVGIAEVGTSEVTLLGFSLDLATFSPLSTETFFLRFSIIVVGLIFSTRAVSRIPLPSPRFAASPLADTPDSETLE